jgi:uncharacterized repeat protein (TIGR03803 family)
VIFVNGALYGMTTAGGTNDQGTIFKIPITKWGESGLELGGEGFEPPTLSV